MTGAMLEVALGDIIIADRHRQDLGDIPSLAEFIERLGLLQPVGLRADLRLVFGHRRVEAFRLLKRKKIPAIIIEDGNELLREAHENTKRLDFSPAEAVAIGKDIEAHEAALAKQRMLAGVAPSGKLPQADFGKTRDKVASVVGMSGRSYEKAKAVVEAAEQNPERFADLLAEMDESRSVDAAFQKLNQRKAREAYEARKEQGGCVEDLQALIDAGKRFPAIYLDPPWEFRVYSGKGKRRSAERYYDVMTLDSLKALPIEALAATHCALLMWAVNPEWPEALALIEAWGFKFQTIGFHWVKLNPSGVGYFMGMGYWTRSNVEPVLLATRGDPQRLAMDVPQLIVAPVREHSRKPDETYGRIERLLAGPYLELFAREERPGWTTWGNEIPRGESREVAP